MNCKSCKSDVEHTGGYFSWIGKPFSEHATSTLCYYCGNTIRPKIAENIAIVGTNSGDTFTMKEMLAEGFDDKEQIIASIKSVGAILGLSPKEIKNKLKS